MNPAEQAFPYTITQIKSTLTVKPAGFHMHATPRKDMLIDPASFPQAFTSASKKVSSHAKEEQKDQAVPEGHQKIYIYYGP